MPRHDLRVARSATHCIYVRYVSALIRRRKDPTIALTAAGQDEAAVRAQERGNVGGRRDSLKRIETVTGPWHRP